MKFKVGDRVKYNGNVGHITDISLGAEDLYRVNGFWSREEYLELIQEKDPLFQGAWLRIPKFPYPLKEPVPGKFYKTRFGLKLLYVGMGNLDRFVYQEEDGYVKQYVLPFHYFDDRSESALDIVGEWMEETKLPSLEIKRWVVVLDNNFKEIKRGEVIGSYSSYDNAKTAIGWKNEDATYEIVELTGTLPERKG